MYKLYADNSAFMPKDFQIRNGQVDGTVAVKHFAVMFGR